MNMIALTCSHDTTVMGQHAKDDITVVSPDAPVRDNRIRSDLARCSHLTGFEEAVLPNSFGAWLS